MANLRLSTATRNALADQITALVDAGTGPGVLNVYAGVQPATANDPITGTLLVTITLSDPAVAAAVAGVANFDFSPNITGTPVASGTATHFRITDSAGNVVLGGDVGTTGTTMTVDNATVTAGGTFTVTAGSVTAPAGA